MCFATATGARQMGGSATWAVPACRMHPYALQHASSPHHSCASAGVHGLHPTCTSRVLLLVLLQVLYDLGVVSTPEPFHRLVSQGMILGEVEYTAFRSEASGQWTDEADRQAVPVKVWARTHERTPACTHSRGLALPAI